MKLRITANTALLRRYLEVDEVGVVYCETAGLGGMHRFSYDQIDAVLRDHAHLSIQVGRDTYKIPYSAVKSEHTQLVAMLVDGCRKTLA
jgi:hypothetical protein